MSSASDDRIISAHDLVARLSLSRSTLWRLVRRGELPRPLRLSPGRVGWLESDVRKWLESRRITPVDGE